MLSRASIGYDQKKLAKQAKFQNKIDFHPVQEEEDAECDLSPIESEVCTEVIDFGLEHSKKQTEVTEEETRDVAESDKKQHVIKRENGWYKGILNDGLK